MLLDLQYIPHAPASAPAGSDDWWYLEGERLKRKRSAALAIALLADDDALLALLS